MWDLVSTLLRGDYRKERKEKKNLLISLLTLWNCIIIDNSNSANLMRLQKYIHISFFYYTIYVFLRLLSRVKIYLRKIFSEDIAVLKVLSLHSVSILEDDYFSIEERWRKIISKLDTTHYIFITCQREKRKIDCFLTVRRSRHRGTLSISRTWQLEFAEEITCYESSPNAVLFIFFIFFPPCHRRDSWTTRVVVVVVVVVRLSVGSRPMIREEKGSYVFPMRPETETPWWTGKREYGRMRVLSCIKCSSTHVVDSSVPLMYVRCSHLMLMSTWTWMGYRLPKEPRISVDRCRFFFFCVRGMSKYFSIIISLYHQLQKLLIMI